MKYGESIRTALFDALVQNDKVIVLGEDIRDPYGGAFKITKGLSTAFGDRVINTPISESAITGIATGLSLSGYYPVLEIMFGDFLTLCADQIVNEMTKFPEVFGIDVPVVIRAPAGGFRGYGPTHSQSLETMFLDVSGLTIMAPSILHNPGDMLLSAIEKGTPVLFVEAKTSYPRQLVQASVTPGNNAILSPMGSKEDLTIITYGSMVPLCIDVATIAFMEEEIVVKVVAVGQLDVLDAPVSGPVVVVEEGRGWTDRIAKKLYDDGLSHVVTVSATSSSIPSAKHLEESVLPGRARMLEVIYANT